MSSSPETANSLLRATGPDRSPSGREWREIAIAYKQAADALVDRKADERAHTYPIAFLYRHYLEMELKSVLAGMIVLFGAERPQEKRLSVLQAHDLRSIFLAIEDVLKPHRARWNAPQVERGLADLQSLVEDIHDCDPQSFAFRYPISKRSAEPCLPDSVEVDVQSLRSRVASVTWLLDSLHDAVVHDVNAIADLADFEREFGFLPNAFIHAASRWFEASD